MPKRTMDERVPPRRTLGLWRLRASGLITGALMIVLILWSAVWVMLEQHKSAALEREARYTTLLVRGMAARIAHTVADGKMVAAGVSSRLTDSPVEDALGPLPVLLIEARNGLDALLVYGNDARAVYATQDAPTPSPEVVARWLELAKGAPHSQPLLGPLEYDAARGWYVPLIARYDARGQQPGGVVVVSVSPDFIVRPYFGPDVGDWLRLMIVGPQGRMWARRVGGREGGVGETIAGSDLYRTLAARHAGSGVLSGALDGVERMDSFEWVQEVNAWVVAGASIDELLQQWRMQRDAYVLFAALVSVLIFALAGWGMHVFVREHASAVALARARDEAEAASRLKSEFVTTMSHELRTPLSSIVGFAELLLTRDFSAEQRIEYLQSVLAAGRHLSRVVNDLLCISKIEAGKMPIDWVDTPVRPLVQSCVQLHRAAAQAKGLSMREHIDPNVPDTLRVDPTRLTQVLTNLLGNAVKFTDQGFVALEVRREGDAVVFVVEDTGPGIAPEYRSQIFERFRQGDPALALRHGGTGLGLPLAKSLVDMMGGTLTLESEVGRGTRFIVRMPVA